MRLPQTIFCLLTFFTLGQALALPGSLDDLTEASKELFKRKGGGGGGGRGGGSSSSSGSSGGSRSGGSSSGSSSSGRTSTSSNTGGATRSGSGTSRGVAGGKYYGGGAATPYGSGARRPGLAAPLLVGAGALAILPAFALYGAYSYGYPYYWSYRNATSNSNETHPAQCWCARYQSCSCDQNNDTEYINSVANNISMAKLVRLPDNDTDTLIINGTLENGTTAPGGTDDDESAAGMGLKAMIGYWPMVAVAVASAYVS